MTVEIKTIKELTIPEAHIALKDDGIVYVKFKKNLSVDIPVQIKLLGVYAELIGDQRTPFLFEAEEGVTITKEARENAPSLEETSPVKAAAVVVSSIPHALVANFYVKFNKPKRPYKVFNKKEEAVEWLKSHL